MRRSSGWQRFTKAIWCAGSEGGLGVKPGTESWAEPAVQRPPSHREGALVSVRTALNSFGDSGKSAQHSRFRRPPEGGRCTA